MTEFKNGIFILLSYLLAFSQGENTRNSTLHAVTYGDRCVWSAPGGNLTSAKKVCDESGGNIFTFNVTSEALAILDALNITHESPVFIGAIRVHGNGSSFFDWLSRPGTWTTDIDVDVTSEEEFDDQKKYICIKLIQRSMSLTNCSVIMPITVCENNSLLECYDQRDPFNSFQPAMINSGSAQTATKLSHDPLTNDSMTSYPPKSSAVVAGPSITKSDDSRKGVEQTTIAKGICHAATCPDLWSVMNSPHSASTTSTESIQERLSSSEQNTLSTTTKGVDLGELMIVPSENGTRITNFSSLLSEIVEKSHLSTDTESTPVPPIPIPIAGANMSGNFTSSKDKNLTNRPPVREVKFQTANTDKIFHGGVQVSGINSGSVQPYAPLLIDNYSHEIEQLENTSRILKTLKQEQHVNNQTLQVFADTVQAASSDGLISAETDELKKDLFSDIMSVGEELVKKLPASIMEMAVETDKIVLFSKIHRPKTSVSTVFVEVDHPHTDTHIHLDKSIFETDRGSDVRVSTIAYKKMHAFMKASNKHLTSTVVSVTVQYIKGNETSEPPIKTENAIVFEMKTKIQKGKVEKNRMCTYWDFLDRVRIYSIDNCDINVLNEARKWSSAGCNVVSKNNSHTTCKCNHLTNFAILVMYIETENISLQNQQALFTLTTVGCSLSIACLVMTLICYIYLQMLTNEKIMIHANLSVALLLGQIVFVASGDAHRNAMACKVVAILLHFLFMASFTWMMVEGIALYLCCTKGIFHHRDMRVKYFLFGWGLPLIIVVISLAARFPDYGSGPQYSCWLSIDDGLIWAFLGPILVIVVVAGRMDIYRNTINNLLTKNRTTGNVANLPRRSPRRLVTTQAQDQYMLNIGVMGLVIKCFLTLRANSEKTEVARLRGSLRAMMTLLPLLGVTWILSLLVPFSVVFHYFFVIFNTVQGMCIFFLHCICNEEIRKKFYEKRRRWSTTRTGSDAEMTFPSRRKTGSFDAIRVAATTTTLPAEYASRSAWT